MKIIENSVFDAITVPGINGKAENQESWAVREHRRKIGTLVDQELKKIASDLGMSLGEKYSPYDASFTEDGRTTYVDFKFIGGLTHNVYAGWMMNMHFSEHEFKFAKANNLTFMVYMQVPDTEKVVHVLTFDFADALEKGRIQFNERDKNAWRTIDLFFIDPNLRSIIGHV